MSKVVTVQDYLKHKDPDKYKDSTDKRKEIEFGSAREESEKQELLKAVDLFKEDRDDLLDEIKVQLKEIKGYAKINEKYKKELTKIEREIKTVKAEIESCQKENSELKKEIEEFKEE